MKLIIEESSDQKETEIIIKCAYIDEFTQRMIKRIRSYSYELKGEKNGNVYNLFVDDVHYFESVDEQSFAYMEHDVYVLKQKLYELEEFLQNTPFIRISKSCIVNIDALVHIRPLFDGKFEAETIGGEKLIINRHYVKSFKEAFGL